MGVIKWILTFFGWLMACGLVFMISEKPKIISRVVIGLCLALPLGNAITLVPSTPWLNLVIWAVVGMGLAIAMTQLPRSRYAGFYVVS